MNIKREKTKRLRDPSKVMSYAGRQEINAVTSISVFVTYTEASEQNLIEEGIKPLTDALFKVGFNPLVSCEGHLNLKSTVEPKGINGPFYLRPYVGFSCEKSKKGFCDIELLFNVFKEVSGWHVKAWPQLEGHLLWIIEPVWANKYTLINQLLNGVETFDRNRLNKDLAIIQEKIITAFQVNQTNNFGEEL